MIGCQGLMDVIEPGLLMRTPPKADRTEFSEKLSSSIPRERFVILRYTDKRQSRRSTDVRVVILACGCGTRGEKGS